MASKAYRELMAGEKNSRLANSKASTEFGCDRTTISHLSAEERKDYTRPRETKLETIEKIAKSHQTRLWKYKMKEYVATDWNLIVCPMCESYHARKFMREYRGALVCNRCK